MRGASLMNNYSSKNKSEILTFLIINFGITALMGVILFIAYKNVSSEFIENFAIVQMLYPAFATIITMRYFRKEEIKRPVKIFFNIFIVTTIISIIILFIGTFVFKNNLNILSIIIQIIVAISSFVSVIIILRNDDNSFESINLKFNNNLCKIAIILLIFIGLYLLRIGISILFQDDQSFDVLKILSTLLMMPLSLCINAFLSFTIFFGEEFGWRGYLQPRLQNIFGKRLGVLILGFIWGIWHLPLCFTLYSPETPIYCVINHILFCVFLGIFLGFAYMKTNNLWTPILIHFANNTIGMALTGGKAGVITLKALIFAAVLNIITYGPFIFLNEYKKDKDKTII